MELELVIAPDERLDTAVTKEWDFDNPQYDAKELRASMIGVMKQNRGIGLSANQVGIMDARCFVFQNNQANNDYERNVLALHPSYEIVEDEPEIDMWEGCLSFPGITLQIKRPSRIKAKWKGVDGKEYGDELFGYQARCFMHELDHLDGISMNEHVSPKIWREAVANAEEKKT
tara:strand:+ start:601 stop:1119 length:519 start_codon:yes stop_codon:yes gene_type:complete